MSRIRRNAQPTPLTPEDRARQAAALAAYDRRLRALRVKQRLSRLAVIAAAIALTVWLFYAGTA